MAFANIFTQSKKCWQGKPFEELDIIDDFLLNLLATDPEVGIPFCRRLLSVLLQRTIGEIRVVAQRTIPALAPECRGIRMDVEIEELAGIDGDGLQFIYFNTQGTKGGSEEIRKLLCFLQESKEKNVTDESTRELFDYVSRVKIRPEARMEYMKFDEWLAWEKRDVMEETKQNDILELLEEYGDIPEEVRQCIEKETSLETLKKWLKLAAKVASLQEFMDKMAQES